MVGNIKRRVVRAITSRTKQKRPANPLNSKRKATFEEMKQLVEKEMVGRRKQLESMFGTHWRKYFFNNFRLFLPGEKRINSQFQAPSSRRGKTIQQTVDDVNDVIHQLHINPKSISELQPRTVAKRLEIKSPVEMTPTQRKTMEETSDQLYEIAAPIYIEMRRRGYSHKDLVQ
ncbi:MAG: hypothetical protein NTY48_06730 [Candidatus Diapherotrites archaeon]|nr:hypothetical protein [Candidatus Diapherotrites archaeon]